MLRWGVVNVSPSVYNKAMNNIRCPFCGSELEFILEYTASYSEHRDFTGIECDNWECRATWDSRGTLIEGPK